MSTALNHILTQNPSQTGPYELAAQNAMAQPPTSPLTEKTILYANDKTASSLGSEILKENHDTEKGEATTASHDLGSTEEIPKGRLGRLLSHWKVFTQIFIWLLFTG
jgi:S-adenosylmethionine:diacylglycerol 3-amino-3-carboxypropyl transferase